MTDDVKKHEKIEDAKMVPAQPKTEIAVADELSNSDLDHVSGGRFVINP